MLSSSCLNCELDSLASRLEKVHIDGMLKGSLHVSTCGATFRKFEGKFLGGSFCPLQVETAFITERMAVILAIEHASIRGWSMLWIECDSTLTMLHLRNKWLPPP